MKSSIKRNGENTTVPMRSGVVDKMNRMINLGVILFLLFVLEARTYLSRIGTIALANARFTIV
jgi:hypothetical protein